MFLTAAGVVIVCGLSPVLYWGGNLDAAWYLYVARRVLSGAHLYRDIIEINPPLIVLMSAPVVLLARVLRASDLAVYDVSVAALAAGCVAFAVRQLRYAIGEDRVVMRRAVALLLLIALVPLAIPDFGQREHLLLALILPYLCLSAARAEGGSAPTWEALAVGLMAGIGFALKPFYAPIWIVTECYLIFARRAGAPWKRFESFAIGVFLVLYGVAVLAVFPEYLGLVTWLGPIYASLLWVPISTMILSKEGFLALFAVLALVPRREPRGLRAVLLAAVAASLAAVLIQHKGWSYHYYPIHAEAFVVLGLALLARGSSDGRRWGRALVVLPAVLALDLGLVLTKRAREAVAQGSFQREIAGEMAPLVRQYAAGQSILGLTISPEPSFPLVNVSGVDWAMRFPSLWMIPALYARERWASLGDPVRSGSRSRDERYLIDAVTTDFVARRPAVIIVYASPRGAPDLAGYLASADHRFAVALGDYRRLRVVSGYTFLVRNSETSR